jgi:hypothetical protein
MLVQLDRPIGYFPWTLLTMPTGGRRIPNWAPPAWTRDMTKDDLAVLAAK